MQAPLIQVVHVGGLNGELIYWPEKVVAPIGSIVQFQFNPKVSLHSRATTILHKASILTHLTTEPHRVPIRLRHPLPAHHTHQPREHHRDQSRHLLRLRPRLSADRRHFNRREHLHLQRAHQQHLPDLDLLLPGRPLRLRHVHGHQRAGHGRLLRPQQQDPRSLSSCCRRHDGRFKLGWRPARLRLQSSAAWGAPSYPASSAPAWGASTTTATATVVPQPATSVPWTVTGTPASTPVAPASTAPAPPPPPPPPAAPPASVAPSVFNPSSQTTSALPAGISVFTGAAPKVDGGMWRTAAAVGVGAYGVWMAA